MKYVLIGSSFYSVIRLGEVGFVIDTFDINIDNLCNIQS